MRIIDGQPPEGFDCGNPKYNQFLYQRAWRDAKRSVTVTHLLYVKGILAGFVTLMMDRVALGPQERPKGVSWRVVGALKVAQLAVDRRFTGRGLGADLLTYCIEYAREVRTKIGCRLVTLDAEPELVGWYERQGFEHNQDEQQYRIRLALETGRDVAALPVSMRYDLRDARD